MAGPWERYSQPAADAKPWERYAEPATQGRGALEQAAAIPVQAASGFNDRLAEVAGAPVDLLGRGLRAVGLPVPEDAFGGSASIQRGIRSITGEPPVPQGALEEGARGAGRGVVDAATVLVPAAGVARLSQAGGLANRVATQAAALPGLQVGSAAAGGAVSEATDSPLAGVATALALPLGLAGGARLISPVQNTLSPARAALVQAAEREGIPLSAGQATGSRTLQNMEGAFQQLPGTSGAEAAFGQEQARAFNRAVLRRAGVDADSAAPEVLNEARARIGGTIGEIAGRNRLRIDDDLLNRLAQQEDEISRFSVPEVSRPIRERMMQIVGQVDENGEVPGQLYRELDSALGRSMKGTANGDLRNAIGDLRNTLREGMDNSITGDDAEAFREARRQYANLMLAAKAAGGAGAGAAEGNISPLALRGALDQSTGGGYAFGRGDLNELARIGQGVLRAPPDSGTAGRTQMNQLLTGGGLSAGGSTVGALIGGPVGAAAGAVTGLALPAAVRAAYVNPLMQTYLRNQAVRPGVRDAITGLRNNLLTQQAVGRLTD
jgi:hypothetical protein